MNDQLKRLIIRNLISPFGIALMSYGIFLFSWLFPPQLYTQLMREPDYMFLNWRSFVFCTVCVGAFLLGVTASRLSFASMVRSLFGVQLTRRSSALKAERSAPPSQVQTDWRPLLVPIAISALLGCVTLVVIGIKTDNVALILAEQGEAIKDAIAARANTDLSLWGKLIPLGPVHMAIIWWFAFRLRQATFSSAARRWMLCMLWFAVLVASANSIIHEERVTLIPILAGLFAVFSFTGKKARAANLWPVLKPLVFGAVGIVGVFFLLSLLRGNVIAEDAGQTFLGYTIASYNRLVLLLNGALRFDYPGNIQDLCWFFSSNKYFNAVIPYASIFKVPDSILSWESDFGATAASGLLGSFIYPSVFGYVFRDIGWWSPVYFFCQGAIVGRAWTSFQKGRVFGLMIYPWCVFAILFWFGWNLLLSDTFFYVSAGSIFVDLYERSFFSALRARRIGL